MKATQKDINVFIAYSRKDTSYLDKLRIYLKPLHRNKTIKIWYDGEIAPGTVWEDQIKIHLHKADIILLLVSANSLASDYFYDREMTEAMERHSRNETIVVPVILSDCTWELTDLANLQALPKDGKPIVHWSDESSAYANIVRGLDKSIKVVRQRRNKSSEALELEQQQQVRIAQQQSQQEEAEQKRIELQRQQKRASQRQKEAEQHRKTQTIANKLNTASDYFAKSNYKESIVFADAVLKLDNGNNHAQQLKSDAQTILNEQKIANLNNAKSKALKFGLPILALLLLVFGISKINWSGNTNEITEDKKNDSKVITLEPETDIDKNLSAPIQKLLSDMVSVSGGIFTMGCTSEQKDCGSDEKPTHSVTLSSYKIAKYELTQEQWRAVMGSDPSSFKGCNQCPVESVSWNDIQDFIIKLNTLTGKRFRLPREAEWEYAARGGKKSNGYQYAGGNTLKEVAWYGGNSGKKTHSVGQKRPNELGLYDMSGNVWEWCSDGYDENYYANSPSDNPKGASSGRRRVGRGGSWDLSYNVCRVSYRGDSYSVNRNYIVGFRVAQD
jgi:formylglycine-generating enzyme required for sulfatase activity